MSAVLAAGLFGPGVAFAQAEGSFVEVPSDYVYDPARGGWNDYCTNSPESFPGSPEADFRGPCARHDMCYEAHTAGKESCDNNLYWDLWDNCDYTYDEANWQREWCHTDADVYWEAVTAFGGY